MPKPYFDFKSVKIVTKGRKKVHEYGTEKIQNIEQFLKGKCIFFVYIFQYIRLNKIMYVIDIIIDIIDVIDDFTCFKNLLGLLLYVPLFSIILN